MSEQETSEECINIPVRVSIWLACSAQKPPVLAAPSLLALPGASPEPAWAEAKRVLIISLPEHGLGAPGLGLGVPASVLRVICGDNRALSLACQGEPSTDK